MIFFLEDLHGISNSFFHKHSLEKINIMDLIPEGGTLCIPIVKLVKHSILRHQQNSKTHRGHLELLQLISATFLNLGNPFIVIYLQMKKNNVTVMLISVVY